MAVLCVGRWSSFLAHQPRSRTAAPKAEASRFSAPSLSSRRSCPSLHCTDPSKSTPSPSPPQEGASAPNTQNSTEADGQASSFRRIEILFGKLFRGRLWFLILVFLLTALGVAYSYLVFTFADVADVPILGVTR